MISAIIFGRAFTTPQEWFLNNGGWSECRLFTLQIKNIKLHIVTDIKVTINSMLGFRISSFGWGAGHFNLLKKSRQTLATHIQAIDMDNWPINIDNY